jgi:2-dehydro-3-deoxygluconokinase
MIKQTRQAFPQTSVFATTLREVKSANTHLWGAILFNAGEWHVIEPREIGVLDRIGGGDGFVGGMLYGILRGWTADKWAQFGWANGAFTVTLLTDYSTPMDEDQIWSVWKGNARVKR